MLQCLLLVIPFAVPVLLTTPSIYTQTVTNKKLCYSRQTTHTICQSKLLHNCVGTSFTRNPEQIEVMELQGYSQLMCNKLRASSHDTLDYRRSNPQALPSTTFIDHKFGESSRGEYPYFWRYQNFLTTRYRIGHQRKLPCRKPASFDTILACDGQTDRWTHNDSKY